MQTELTNYTAIIGIGWADKKHDVCIQVTATGKQELLQIPHQSETIDEWARSLQPTALDPLALAMSDVPAPDLRRVGCADDQQIVLGRLVLLSTTSKRLLDQAAVRALAFMWIRILYRCWKTHTPYDEARYLNLYRNADRPCSKQQKLLD